MTKTITLISPDVIAQDMTSGETNYVPFQQEAMSIDGHDPWDESARDTGGKRDDEVETAGYRGGDVGDLAEGTMALIHAPDQEMWFTSYIVYSPYARNDQVRVRMHSPKPLRDDMPYSLVDGEWYRSERVLLEESTTQDESEPSIGPSSLDQCEQERFYSPDRQVFRPQGITTQDQTTLPLEWIPGPGDSLCPLGDLSTDDLVYIMQPEHGSDDHWYLAQVLHP